MLKDRTVEEVKKYLDETYLGRMDVFIEEWVTDSNGEDIQIKRQILTGEKCRLGFKSGNFILKDTHNRTEQDLVVYCRPEIDIPEGATIELIQHSTKYTLNNAQRGRKYRTHIEYAVEEIIEHV